MELTSIPVKSWTTRKEAEEYCQSVADAIPGARVECHANGQQVKTVNGEIPVYFKRADNGDVRRTPHVKGLFQRCK